MKKLLMFLFLMTISLGQSQNLITNGDFENGTTGWSFGSPGTVVNGEAYYSTANATGNTYGTELYQQNLSFTAGAKYTLTFRARAAANRNISVNIQNTGIWNDQFRNDAVALTTDMTDYSYTFTAPFTNGAVQLNFHMANMGTNTTEAVYIDDVSIVLNPTLTNFSVPAKLVGDAAFELTPPTTNSAGAFTYGSSNTAVATISGSTVTIVGIGSSTITATQAANGSYGAGSITATLVVTSTPLPTLGALTVPAKFVGDAAFNLTDPSSNSTGAFTYMSSNMAVATISGSTVTIVGPGSSTITATQAATASYDTGSVSAQLVVTYGPPSVGASNPIARNAWDVKSLYGGIYTNEPSVIFDTFDGGAASIADVTLDDSNVVAKYVGHRYSGISAGAGNLDVSSMTKLHLDVYSTDASFVSSFRIKFEAVNGSVKELDAPASPTRTIGNWISYDIDLSTYTGVDLTHLKWIVPVTTATWPTGITMYIDNVYFWRPATTTPLPTFGTFTVPAKVVGDSNFDLTAPSSNSAGAITYMSSNTAVATISGSTVSIVGVGSSTITATQAADGSFGAGNVAATLNVNPNSAPTPANAAEDVISVFSNAYTDLANTNFFPNWGQSTQYVQVNGMLKYSNLNYQGITFASPINISAMEKLHIDIFTTDCTSFQMFVLDGSDEQSVTLTPSFNGWNSFDISLSQYTLLTKSNILEFKIVGNGTVYLDNIYFWKLPAGSESYYVDADADGYGAGAATVSTTPIVGSVTNATDCNDSSSVSYPGATEIADGLDNDCDNSIDEGFPPSTGSPFTPPTRNAWDVVSIFSGAYSNVTIDQLPTNWSQLATVPFSVESIGGNDTWKFGGEFLGMEINSPGINLTQMTTMHIDYWTPDNKIMIAKIVNTVDGGEANTIVQDPVVTGTWRSVDIPMAQFGASLNKSKITQILLDPQLGGSTVYVDNFYFYRAATGAPTPTIGALTVPAKVIGDANFELTAPSSNSAGAFTFTSSNTNVATIEGTTVTIVGAGSSIITATQAAAGSYGAGSTQATLVVSLNVAAPTPTIPVDRVLSVYSDAAGYGTLAGTSFYPNWGQVTQYAQVDVVGNSTLRYSNLNYQGIQLGSVLDISSYDSVHLNIYGGGTTAVDFRVINQAGGAGSPDVERVANTAITLNPGWNSVVIPVASLTTATAGFELNRVGQLSFTGSGTIFVDNIFFSKAVPTPVAPTATSIAFCKGSASALTAVPSGTNLLKWYTVATGGTALTSAPTPTATRQYWVAQVMSSGVISPRATLTATINNLPTTLTGLASLEAKNICKYIGSSNPVTFTATATGASSYIWTAPTGAVIDPDGGQADISFEDVSAIPGSIGSVTVKIVDANGCISLPKVLALTTALPKAPTSLLMTSANSTPHFKGIITPAVGETPAVTGLVGLNYLTAGIKKVGPYMGTSTVFTLTAAEASTAASYEWTLNGATQLSGGTSNEITVKFDGAALKTIGALPIVVKSVAGCGTSTTIRTLALARAIPTAPTKLVLTDEAITLSSTVTTKVVTKVGPYTDKSTELTLTATPFTTQGATATSYAWVLPAGVNCTSEHATGVTLTGSTTVDGVTTPWTINNAIGTASSTITINLDGVASGVTSLPMKVFAVNGAGNSIARTLTLTAAAPATPGAITSGGVAPKFNPTCATSTTITVQVPAVAGATYAWTVAGIAGSNSRIVSGNGSNSIVINVAGVSTAKLLLSVVASNGTGSSAARILDMAKTTTCATRIAPEATTATDKFSAVAYPNPSTEGFRVKSSNGKSFGVQVYDMLGRSIEKRQMSSDAQIGSNYAKGIYNVIVNQGANVKTLRVIKQ